MIQSFPILLSCREGLAFMVSNTGGKTLAIVSRISWAISREVKGALYNSINLVRIGMYRSSGKCQS